MYCYEELRVIFMAPRKVRKILSVLLSMTILFSILPNGIYAESVINNQADQISTNLPSFDLNNYLDGTDTNNIYNENDKRQDNETENETVLGAIDDIDSDIDNDIVSESDIGEDNSNVRDLTPEPAPLLTLDEDAPELTYDLVFEIIEDNEKIDYGYEHEPVIVEYEDELISIPVPAVVIDPALIVDEDELQQNIDINDTMMSIFSVDDFSYSLLEEPEIDFINSLPFENYITGEINSTGQLNGKAFIAVFGSFGYNSATRSFVQDINELISLYGLQNDVPILYFEMYTNSTYVRNYIQNKKI